MVGPTGKCLGVLQGKNNQTVQQKATLAPHG